MNPHLFRTREVKLGCVFTQTTQDEEGYAIRDPDSSTYTGGIETAEEFGRLPDRCAGEPRLESRERRGLDKGKIEKLILSLRSTESTNSEVLEKIRTAADYFERNAERMRYPKFRRQHLFIGSGVIEAGRRTVIGCRL
ncbi:MAG: hypothetical protein IT167_27180 [Bryobacterales bacterium]|nr:hypothetical protein [Bryobacterales bacterium]